MKLSVLKRIRRVLYSQAQDSSLVPAAKDEADDLLRIVTDAILESDEFANGVAKIYREEGRLKATKHVKDNTDRSVTCCVDFVEDLAYDRNLTNSI